MSRIAEALAKAKEKTGDFSTAFPPHDAGAPPAGKSPTNLLRIAQRRQRFWVGFTALVVPLSVFATWAHLKENNLIRPRAVEQAPASSAETPRLADATQTHVSETDGKQHLISAFAKRVDLLSISAVMPGEPPRIMVHGRIFRLGEAVESGILFTGIHNGELTFTAVDGATHKRRP